MKICSRCKINPQGTTKPYCKTCKNTMDRLWRERTGKVYKQNHAQRKKGGPLVYAYFDNTKAIYVGRGSYERAHSHKYSDWWHPNLLLITMTCDDEWQAMEYEGKWGGRYQPILNKDGYRYKEKEKLWD